MKIIMGIIGFFAGAGVGLVLGAIFCVLIDFLVFGSAHDNWVIIGTRLISATFAVIGALAAASEDY